LHTQNVAIVSKDTMLLTDISLAFDELVLEKQGLQLMFEAFFFNAARQLLCSDFRLVHTQRSIEKRKPSSKQKV
jgi:hypothetical protein